MDLAVIIVHYKTLDLTRNCLTSVLASEFGDLQVEILVIDNASGDGSIEIIEDQFPGIRVIKNTENLGFAGANNIGISATKAKVVLLLNSDTVVQPNAILSSYRYLVAHEDIGALGCKILLSDGKLDPACKRSFPTPGSALCHMAKLDRLFPKSRLFGKYNLTYLDENQPANVDCLTGAFMMVPKEVIATVGGLDEDYFMYGEDIDWCYRIVQSGKRIVYDPEGCITHFKRASGMGKRNPKVVAAFYDSMGIFYGKHYQSLYSPILRKLVLWGISVLKKHALKKNERMARK